MPGIWSGDLRNDAMEVSRQIRSIGGSLATSHHLNGQIGKMMSETGHDLQALFPAQRETLHLLKLESAQYRELADRHHALRISDPHRRYHQFVEYGDAEGYRARLMAFREALREESPTAVPET
jgi:hypothetical protein